MKKAALSEVLMHALLTLCGMASVGLLLLIIVYMILAGFPAIREIGLVPFLFGIRWSPTAVSPGFGILPMILTTLYGALAATLLAVPIGFLTAIYLTKIAPRPVATVLRPMIDILAGIPSVVYGLVGMLILVPTLRETMDLPAGDNLLAAIIVLTVMILPSVISVSATALSAVPPEYEEGSLALGATMQETCFRVSAPAARSGLAAAVVLGIGRAIGEAMAVLMVAGNVANMPSLLKSVRFLTTGIAMEMNYAGSGSLHRQALFSIGLVLFLFIMAINLTLQFLLKRERSSK